MLVILTFLCIYRIHRILADNFLRGGWRERGEGNGGKAWMPAMSSARLYLKKKKRAISAG